MQVIEPEKELKTESFGKGMSGRVSACASVAQAVKVSYLFSFLIMYLLFILFSYFIGKWISWRFRLSSIIISK